MQQNKLKPKASVDMTSCDIKAMALAQAINFLITHRASDDNLLTSSATIKFSNSFSKILLMKGSQNPDGTRSYLYNIDMS